MARNSLWVTALAGVLAAQSARAAEPKTSELGADGRFHQISEPTSKTEVVANPLLDRAEQQLDANRVEAAHDIISPWLKENPKAPDRDRALFLLARIYYTGDHRLVAFYHLDELMDKFPESRFYRPALEMQFKIADAFLNGHKRKFLGLPVLSADDEAIEMLYRIQERAPGSDIAERSLLRTADYYFRTSQFDLSADAYAAFARSYSRSPEIPSVKLRQAFSSLAQFRGKPYDASPLLDARQQFREIVEKYPELAAEENVQDRIERIDNTLAGKLYLTADFYRRTHQPRAAVYVYRTLIATYPASRDAQNARRALDTMPAWALKETPAGETQTQTPATAPSTPAATDVQK